MNNLSSDVQRLQAGLAAIPAPDVPIALQIAGLRPHVALDVAISRAARVALHDDEHVRQWLAACRSRASLHATRQPLASLRRWRINPETRNIEHDAGKFFVVLGVRARHRHGFDEITWDQPAIDQAEVGILGILATKIGGILHVCLQAKEEPGNIGGVQLSPTVQATYSNYTRSHGGQQTSFVDLFLNPAPESILFARLQTEDGGRFLYKSNRNMVVLCDHERLGATPDRFIWLTLRQVAVLMRQDNAINACSRSVLCAFL
jgi:oxidase EvaA